MSENLEGSEGRDFVEPATPQVEGFDNPEVESHHQDLKQELTKAKEDLTLAEGKEREARDALEATKTEMDAVSAEQAAILAAKPDVNNTAELSEWVSKIRDRDKINTTLDRLMVAYADVDKAREDKMQRWSLLTELESQNIAAESGGRSIFEENTRNPRPISEHLEPE